MPLRQLANFGFAEGLNEINRDNGKRRIFVEINVRNRDIASFVADAQAAVARDVRIPPGFWLEWGGQFKNLQQAIRRLEVVVPVCMILIFSAPLHGARECGSCLDGVHRGAACLGRRRFCPRSSRPSVLDLGRCRTFIAVSGVAVLNGLVLVASIRRRWEDGEGAAGAIFNGAVEKFRPVLMTALVASLGFVPMAIATGTGSEIQRPLATVVIGGLVTSTALTLFLLPAVCGLLLRRAKTERGTRADADRDRPLRAAE